MTEIKLAKHRDCTGCMACVDTCQQKAIQTMVGKDGHRYPVIDTQKCVSCGLCMKKCPIINNFEYRLDADFKPLLAWSNDDEIRMRSASGGIFGGIAYKVLEEGGYVCGCRMDGLIAKHVIIDNKEDLQYLQGSKYVHSDMTGVYNEIRNLLKLSDKPVLYSGTRCQVAGLLSYLGRSYEKLITLDLVCGGVPSTYLLDFYQGKYKTIRSFRNKKNGWKHGYSLTLVNFCDECLESEPDSDIQADGYLVGLTNRYSCYDCKFAKLHSKADLTLMDFWGEKEHPEEHFKGVSCVIPNTHKGNDLLRASNISVHESTWSKCIPHNHRILYGRSFGASCNLLRMIMPYAFNHWSKETIKTLYVRNLSWSNPLHIPLKLYKYIMWKIMMIHKDRTIKNELKKLQ